MSALPPECYKRTGQCAEININRLVPLNWALPLYGYVMPAIVTITVLTNSFIVLVLSHRSLRTPTSCVLGAMAVCELLTGIICFPWLLYYYTFSGYKTDESDGLPSFWCTAFPYMANILPSMFHTSATWLTVYLAVQRYIYICVPKQVRSHCTLRRSKQMITILILISALFYAPELFANYNQSFVQHHIDAENNKQKTGAICVRIAGRLLKSLGNDVYYLGLYGLHTIFAHTLPCVLLVAFTWRLIAAIREADKRHIGLIRKSTWKCSQLENTSQGTIDASEHQINITISQMRNGFSKTCLSKNYPKLPKTNSLNAAENEAFLSSAQEADRNSVLKPKNSVTESRRVQGLRQNTRMLIAIILLFLVTEIPAALIILLHVGTVAFRISLFAGQYSVFNRLLIMRNVLIVVTYPFRFAIYCGMSQQFREVARQMLSQTAFFLAGCFGRPNKPFGQVLDSGGGNFRRKEDTSLSKSLVTLELSAKGTSSPSRGEGKWLKWYGPMRFSCLRHHFMLLKSSERQQATKPSHSASSSQDEEKNGGNFCCKKTTELVSADEEVATANEADGRQPPKPSSPKCPLATGSFCSSDESTTLVKNSPKQSVAEEGSADIQI